jgi:M-phase inducer tyrosine phosphatase
MYGFDTLIVIDARFEYEYLGGHIAKSMNVRSPADMKIMFDEFRDCCACVVFHCEFSQNRGPTLMQQFREHDRKENVLQYPFLDYPTIYLLQGGYCRFYSECRDLCVGGYVPMRDARFVRSGELRRSYAKYTAEGLNETRRRRAMSDCAPMVPFEYDVVCRRTQSDSALDGFDRVTPEGHSGH